MCWALDGPMRAFCFFTVAALLSFAVPARASDAVTLYARALEAFNPQLDGAQSALLARRTIDEADASGLDARLVVALVATESSWRPDSVSPAGALGLGQLMPGTAAGLGVDPIDPEQNLHGVARHLRALLDRYWDVPGPQRYALALAAYNAGAGAVARYGGIPPYAETQRYVRRVMALWRRLCGYEMPGR
ncbi:MAG: lytic transglycosylase domain-containing protein [Vulcanimicrobiaceae bacterium]